MRLQALFQLEEKHYMGLVFAGKASFKLGQYAEARGYYRKAVDAQPESPLAWKVCEGDAIAMHAK